MEIIEKKADSFVILNLKGRLDTTNYGELEKKILELLEKKENNIIIDCEKLDYISSSGLRILLMGLKKFKANKGKFVLCNLQENIKEIFEISGFSSIFDIYVSKNEALKA